MNLTTLKSPLNLKTQKTSSKLNFGCLICDEAVLQGKKKGIKKSETLNAIKDLEDFYIKNGKNVIIRIKEELTPEQAHLLAARNILDAYSCEPNKINFNKKS